MDFHKDPIVIIGSSCRLPGGVRRASEVWDALVIGEGRLSSTSPASRYFGKEPLFDTHSVGKAGWIDDDGVVTFDPSFFDITPAEASALRPNTRLALELTWEALEVAGIPPSSLKGKNVGVAIGVGSEDGWDLKRYNDDQEGAFDMHWAANSDPSGVSGHVSHFYGFCGPSNVVSSACSSSAFALRDACLSILHDDCIVAIAGGITTHFSPAPFLWASAVNVASRRGQCATFSSEADGYVPSEGAVFLILTRLSEAKRNGSPIHGIIKAIATGHNGSTRALAIPNAQAQESVCRKALVVAGIDPSNVTILEAHGTGTRLGDAIELETIRKIHGDVPRETVLWLSSSKTVFGHCQAASAFVGILKALASFRQRAIPPHGVEPLPELLSGRIQVPIALTQIGDSTPMVAQINSFGFTGSVASVIVEEPHNQAVVESPTPGTRTRYVLPFSAKSTESLKTTIRNVCDWAIKTACNLYDLGALLSLSRDHHATRRCVVLTEPTELVLLRDDPLNYCSLVSSSQITVKHPVPVEELLGLLAEKSHRDRISSADHEFHIKLSAEGSMEQAVAALYERGHDFLFGNFYDKKNTCHYKEHLHSFPTYPFNRKVCWKSEFASRALTECFTDGSKSPILHAADNEPEKKQRVIETIANIVNVSPSRIHSDDNIFDLGIDSISSIELAEALSRSFGSQVSATDLYSFLTVEAILSHLSSDGHDTPSRNVTQVDVDQLVQTYGARFPSALGKGSKSESNDRGRTVLLTGGNGKLGCHVLNRLLLDSSNALIICLVRGEAWDRLASAYGQHGYDLSLLFTAKATGLLKVYKTTNLDDKILGCSREEYDYLLKSVDTIIHAAWRLDFNLPVVGFEDCLSGTRNLAELSIHCSKKVTYFFISSYSSYFKYRDRFLPEEPLSPLLEYSLDQGYAISKLVAEYAMINIHTYHPAFFDLRIVRIGQICGNSITGDWTQDEMVPMIIKSAPFLNAVLRDVPDVSWIPSDVCADVIHDLISCPIPASLKVLHIANPDIVSWREVVGTISSLLNIPNLSLLSAVEYAESVQKAGGNVPIRRLLPYLLHAASHDGFPKEYCSLEVQNTLKLSRALQMCPKVDRQFISSIVTFLVGRDPPISMSKPLQTPYVPVLLFGPWSNISDSGSSQSRASFKVKTLLQGLVSDSRRTIGYTEPDHALEKQIESLAIQLSTVEKLKCMGIEPVAVLGYCFGEFAAAIASGILSEPEVVEILVRRAAALKDVTGSMLNVFEAENTVRRLLLRLTTPPDLAIFAGPRHIVLSGTTQQINAAHELLRDQALKCKLVQTSIPFHSSTMDRVIEQLELPPINPKRAKCVYISGLLGGPIGSNSLGRAYWLRHMRDPVRFYSAMQYLRGTLSINPPYNCGPGVDLISVITRYEWQDVTFSEVQAGVPSGMSERNNSNVFGKVEMKETNSSNRLVSVEDEALAILTGNFSYPHKADLLSKSFFELGLQSMDFVKFTDLFSQSTGFAIPPSSYTSQASLKDILTSLFA